MANTSNTTPYDSAPTSAEAARILFGPQLYDVYVDWQTNIRNPVNKAQYGKTRVWKMVQGVVSKIPVGALPCVKAFKIFLNTLEAKNAMYNREADSASEVKNKVEDNVATLATAELCNHTLHPGFQHTVSICPVCIIRESIAFLTRMSDLWGLIGGPCLPWWKRGRVDDPAKQHQARLFFQLKELWLAEKCRWANLRQSFEEDAAAEIEWERECKKQGFAIPSAVTKTSSCMEALEIASTAPVLLEGSEGVFVAGLMAQDCGVCDESKHEAAEVQTTPPNSPQEPKTTVEEDAVLSHPNDTFTRASRPLPSSSVVASSETAICPPSPLCTPSPAKRQRYRSVTFAKDVMDPTERRSRFFRRSSKLYEKGRYACPNSNQWADTSFMHDILYMGDDEEEEVKVADRGAHKLGRDEEGGGSDVETELDEERPPAISLSPPSSRRRCREEFEEDGEVEAERVEVKRRCAPLKKRPRC